MATVVHTTTVAPELKGRIMSDFWGVIYGDAGSSKDGRLVELYSEHYSQQVQLMLYDGGQNVSVWTHNDIVDVMTRIRDSQGRQDLFSHIHSCFSTDSATTHAAMVDQLIDLSAGLSLMTSFGKANFAVEPQISLDWKQGSVKDVLHQHFNQQCYKQDH